MGEKLFIPGISEIHGEIDKDDWSLLLLEDETMLLVDKEDNNKKIWVMADEWKQTKKKEIPKKVVSETLTLQQIEPEQEVTGGVSEESTEVEWAGDQITLESLKEMRLDELLFYAMLQYKEEEIREKIYCLFGYCQSGCKSCVKEE